MKRILSYEKLVSFIGYRVGLKLTWNEVTELARDLQYSINWEKITKEEPRLGAQD